MGSRHPAAGRVGFSPILNRILSAAVGAVLGLGIVAGLAMADLNLLGRWWPMVPVLGGIIGWFGRDRGVLAILRIVGS